ncbi:hypothetical protein TWF173_002182 [Orbilia oligospora]|nr:hypothetical protein TWF173_002182 [Orbilia oligospora]
MKTSGDRNGAGSSQEPPPSYRTESRVQKLRRNPRPMENPCNTKRSGRTRSSDHVPKPHPEWIPQEAILAANNTVIGIPVLNNVLNEYGNNAVYGSAVEYTETMMEIDSEGSPGNIERLEIPSRPSEELPLSNVSIFSGGSGSLPTSSLEIKSFFIETLPLGPTRFYKGPGQNFPADYSRGPTVDPYGNPIHPGDNFPRRAHPILFVDIERTFDMSATEDMLDASESGMPYTH